MWNSVRFLVRDFNGAVSRDKNDLPFDGKGDTDVVGVTLAHMSICCEVFIAKISIVSAKYSGYSTAASDRSHVEARIGRRSAKPEAGMTGPTETKTGSDLV